jgi:hypothetical protein
MGRQAATALYVLAMIAVVVGVDILFFRHHFWARLLVNVGVVLVFVRRGRCGHPVLQAPLLGAAASKRRSCPSIRGVLPEVPEASIREAAAMWLTQLHGETN